jgi:tetratricopeptide (TPR) repeat protein
LKKYLFLHIVIFSLFFNKADAQTIQQEYEHALNLYHQQEYTSAISSFRRVVFFDDTNYPLSYKLLGDCYKQMGEKAKSLYYYNLARSVQVSDSLSTEIDFAVIALHLMFNEPNFALINLFSLHLRNSKYFQQKTNFYYSLTYYLLHDFDQSQDYFFKVVDTANLELHYSVDSLFNKARKNEKSSVYLPMFLSIVPGLGQFYLGEYRASLNSLLLSTAIFGLYLIALNHVAVLDAIITILPWFQRYYSGGLLQAKALAKKKKKAVYFQIYNALIDLYSNNRVNLLQIE